jgi:hypothetical protein
MYLAPLASLDAMLNYKFRFNFTRQSGVFCMMKQATAPSIGIDLMPFALDLGPKAYSLHDSKAYEN